MFAAAAVSFVASAGAVGNQLCGVPLRRTTPRALIAGSAATGAAGALVYVAAPHPGWLLLTTASLIGVALSPVVAGILGATSIRGVFVLDVIALLALAAVVSRLMVAAPSARPTTPAPEEL